MKDIFHSHTQIGLNLNLPQTDRNLGISIFVRDR